MDWANHYLRKAGHSATLSDLKDISDGHFLPQIIQAVGEEGEGEREGGRERERGREREKERKRERESMSISRMITIPLPFPFLPVHTDIPGISASVESEDDRVSSYTS